MSVIIANPLQYIRQYSGPIDADQVFDTTSAMTAYLSSPRKYAGQIAYNKETSLPYFLNNTLSTWIQIGAGTSIVTKETFTVSGSPSLTYTLPAGFNLNFVTVVPSSNFAPDCTTQGGTQGDIIPASSISTTPADGVVWSLNLFSATVAKNIIITAPISSTIVIIKTQIL